MQELSTDNWSAKDFLREANIQSAHLARLSTIRRLSLSVVAALAIIGMWQEDALPIWALVVLVAVAVVFAAISAVLTIGISRGKDNVKALLEAGGFDAEELLYPKK